MRCRTSGGKRPAPASAGREEWAARSQCRPSFLLAQVERRLRHVDGVEEVDQLVTVELLAGDEVVGDRLHRLPVLLDQLVGGDVRLADGLGGPLPFVAVAQYGGDR